MGLVVSAEVLEMRPARQMVQEDFSAVEAGIRLAFPSLPGGLPGVSLRFPDHDLSSMFLLPVQLK